MSYSINLKDSIEFTYTEKDDISKVELPHELGIIKSQKECISEDILLIKCDSYSFDELHLESNLLINSLSVRVPFKGTISFTDEKGKEHEYLDNHVYVDYYNEANGVYNHFNDTHNEIMVLIKDNFLEQNLFTNLKDEKRKNIEKNYHENVTSHLKNTKASAKTMFLAKQIYNSPFCGKLENLFLQTKVYELLYHEFSNLININDKPISPKIKLSQEDIAALHKAKEIMIKTKDEITIAQLARKVALNENKLKYGFKYLFNTTPYALMLESRLYEAKELLQSSELNVTEIAHQIGYKYVQGFSIAFRRKFGVTPTEIMKSRKYYY